MTETKVWWASKTMWSGLVTSIAGVLALVGVIDISGEQEAIVDNLMGLAAAVAGLVTLVGRIQAKRKIVLVLLLGLMLVGGCGKVWMSGQYKQRLEMANVVIQSLNEDCQGGDDDACRRGLDESAQIVQLIVDAAGGNESAIESGGEIQ